MQNSIVKDGIRFSLPSLTDIYVIDEKINTSNVNA